MLHQNSENREKKYIELTGHQLSFKDHKYIGLTEGTFKKRFYGHQLSFKDVEIPKKLRTFKAHLESQRPRPQL